MQSRDSVPLEMIFEYSELIETVFPKEPLEELLEEELLEEELLEEELLPVEDPGLSLSSPPLPPQ